MVLNGSLLPVSFSVFNMDHFVATHQPYRSAGTGSIDLTDEKLYKLP